MSESTYENLFARPMVVVGPTDFYKTLAYNGDVVFYNDKETVSVILDTDLPNPMWGLDDADAITGPSENGTIEFITSSNDRYKIRPIKDDDGEWITDYKISLPSEVLENMVAKARSTDTESTQTLSVLVKDGIAIALMLVIDGIGTFYRVDGKWSQSAGTDLESASDVFDIAPSKGSEVMERYDRGDKSLVKDLEANSTEPVESGAE